MAYNQKVRETLITEIVSSLKTDRTLYLIGTANRGPVNVPIEIQSINQLKSKFGTEGSLVEAYSSIETLLPKRQVYLVKASGTHATCSLNVNQEGIEADAFQITSKHANEESNGILIELDPCFLHVVHPASMGGHRVSYDLRKYGTMSELVCAMNDDSENGEIEVFATCSYEEWILDYPFYACNPSHLQLSGGQAQLSPTMNEWYQNLEETYETLEGLKVDLVIPLKAYLDASKEIFSKYKLSSYQSATYQGERDYLTLPSACYFEQLQAFCKKQQAQGLFTHGIMGLHPGIEDDDAAYLYYLEQLSNKFDNSSDANEVQAMISVVETEVYYDYYRQNDSGYLVYGALLLNLELQDNPTNKLIGDYIQLVREMSDTNQSKISRLGFVCFRYSPYLKGNTVKVGTTFTKRETELRYFHNLQMCQVTCQAITDVIDGHIGLNLIEIEKYQYIESELTFLLELMVENSILDSYGLAVTYLTDQGTVNVDLSIKTRYMVESIDVSGSLIYQYM